MENKRLFESLFLFIFAALVFAVCLYKLHVVALLKRTIVMFPIHSSLKLILQANHVFMKLLVKIQVFQTFHSRYYRMFKK